ncbi:hypothetical protein GH714_024134 [Hevea brasiliensis]|uniref:Uncharacterized protein n=1 Tax=Hevea brasiliensis TaxID=3981 RepID=A0A6A6LDN3_HEVBR|nr:hypothetical protein GH714_024134 [Hevea brasiliensis]
MELLLIALNKSLTSQINSKFSSMHRAQYVKLCMGVHCWKRVDMEYLIFVYNIWNAVFGSKLDCLFTPRKLCKWFGSFDTDICCISAHCWFGHTPQGIYMFGLGIPLFIDSNEQQHHMKWSLWVVHRLVLTAVYGFILFMYHSKWRERLPARPAFYKYIVIMFTLNALALFACGLTVNGTDFGFWLYSTTIVCYHTFYLPLLYVTFLADFFQEDDLHLENVYYSEMKDAGFFDADWE